MQLEHQQQLAQQRFGPEPCQNWQRRREGPASEALGLASTSPWPWRRRRLAACGGGSLSQAQADGERWPRSQTRPPPTSPWVSWQPSILCPPCRPVRRDSLRPQRGARRRASRRLAPQSLACRLEEWPTLPTTTATQPLARTIAISWLLLWPARCLALVPARTRRGLASGRWLAARQAAARQAVGAR